MRKLQAVGLVALSAVSLVAGCGSSDENDTLNATSGGAVGAAIATQLSTAPASLTAMDLTTGGVGGGFSFARAMPTIAFLTGQASGPSLRAPCPSVDNTTDADGDGVPDNATFTFTQVDCSLGNDYVTGAIHVIDPGVPVGFGADFQHLFFHFEDGSSDQAEVDFDGTHDVQGTATAIDLDENLTTTLDALITQGQQQQHFQGSFHNDWHINFTAARGQTIVMDDLLPDGTLTLDGDFDYDFRGEHFRMVVETHTALVYDATCHGEIHPFTAGEIRAHVRGQNANVYVKLTYANCLEPVVEFVGRTS